MTLTPDDFLALQQDVEAQGGVLIPDRCEPRHITYEGAGGEIDTCYCGENKQFMHAYSPSPAAEKKGATKRGGGLVKVCAVCDMMIRWPKFEEA